LRHLPQEGSPAHLDGLSPQEKAACLVADKVLEAVATALGRERPARRGGLRAGGPATRPRVRDHVRHQTGELPDLVVLAHLLDGTWAGMATAGMEEALLS